MFRSITQRDYRKELSNSRDGIASISVYSRARIEQVYRDVYPSRIRESSRRRYATCAIQLALTKAAVMLVDRRQRS